MSPFDLSCGEKHSEKTNRSRFPEYISINSSRVVYVITQTHRVFAHILVGARGCQLDIFGEENHVPLRWIVIQSAPGLGHVLGVAETFATCVIKGISKNEFSRSRGCSSSRRRYGDTSFAHKPNSTTSAGFCISPAASWTFCVDILSSVVSQGSSRVKPHLSFCTLLRLMSARRGRRGGGTLVTKY